MISTRPRGIPPTSTCWISPRSRTSKSSRVASTHTRMVTRRNEVRVSSHARGNEFRSLRRQQRRDRCQEPDQPPRLRRLAGLVARWTRDRICVEPERHREILAHPTTLSATRIVASPVHHGGVLETCECCRHLAMGAARNGTLQAMFAATNAPISVDSVILAPEVGWTSVDSLGALAPIRSLVSGDEASDRIRIAYFRRERDGTLVGKVWFGPGVEGPPGHAQGGSIAAVLDEAMGAAARMIGHRAIASTLRLRFRLKVPLQRVMTLEASIRAAHGPRLHVNAKVCDDTGAPFAEGSGLFVRLPPERDRTTAEM